MLVCGRTGKLGTDFCVEDDRVASLVVVVVVVVLLNLIAVVGVVLHVVVVTLAEPVSLKLEENSLATYVVEGDKGEMRRKFTNASFMFFILFATLI